MTSTEELLAHSRSIAIIGMACRFPGARNVEEYRRNLADGVESITCFSDEELREAGVDAALLSNPDYVKAAPVLEDIDQFDADFFQYAQRDAEIIDPQQRLFLECAWEALETAGYASDPAQSASRAIGVFGGSGSLMGTYLLSDAHVNEQLLGPICSREHIGNDKDHLCTRVSYKLNLSGPSLTVQTACSTSLVAVHLACQSLLTGECDIALAGGVTIRVPHRTGYLYQKGEVFSPDGHCRAFDAQGEGTLFGSGAGIVVLKPLAQAIADGDAIAAVIRGSAIGNDGGGKMSYWATNHQGQRAAIVRALKMANVSAETIGYVEAHGTATHLGDMIELFALRQAFNTEKKGFCAIGSVKTNIGHLDAAAGVAGLIKAVLSLQHKTLFPSLHFSQPNPRIDFVNSPFYVNITTGAWKPQPVPRRAAVNSLGIGGTNAHLILEEAPAKADRPNEPGRTHHLLTLSAKTPTALQAMVPRFVEHVKEGPALAWPDVCHTANVGRAHFNHRLALVALSQQDAIQQLTAGEAGLVKQGYVTDTKKPKVTFLFTGQGAQYVGMGRGLYETQPTFRATIDRCDELLQEHLGESLLTVLYPDDKASAENPVTQSPPHPVTLSQTIYTQPALFALEYALAQLWQSWGIVPDVVMGHSVGEIVAACVAGVFSLEDGIKLIAARGRLMQALPQNGVMVAVQANEKRVVELIAHAADHVSLAASNGPASVVIAGEGEVIHSIVQDCEREGIKTKPLEVSHAFHSPLMEPMLPAFAEVMQEIPFAKPATKFISNVTGELATDEVATAGYWVAHVRQPVRFVRGIETLLNFKDMVWLEIGPKPILLGMATASFTDLADQPVLLPTLRQGRNDWEQVLDSLAELYVQGVAVNWAAVDQDYQRQRVALPTYPFQRQRYWIDAASRNSTLSGENTRDTHAGEALHPDLLDANGQVAGVHNEELMAAKRSGAVVIQPGFRRELDQADPQAQPQLLMAHLQMLTAKVLGMRSPVQLDPHQSFMTLGMDSLMTVELGKSLTASLEYPFPPAVIFDYPTLEQLSTYICRQVLHLESDVPKPVPVEKKIAPTQELLEPELAELDLAELDGAITNELEALEALLQR